MNKIIRVFPRKTNATPDDGYAFIGDMPLFGIPDDATEVRVSCTFTWDVHYEEYLAKSWERSGLPVKLGGVAFGEAFELIRQGLTFKDTYENLKNICDGVKK